MKQESYDHDETNLENSLNLLCKIYTDLDIDYKKQTCQSTWILTHIRDIKVVRTLVTNIPNTEMNFKSSLKKHCLMLFGNRNLDRKDVNEIHLKISEKQADVKEPEAKKQCLK